MIAELTQQDKEDLAQAIYLLEHPGLAAMISNLIGSPIEKGLQLIPKRILHSIESVTHKALEKAVRAAIFTLPSTTTTTANNRLHQVSVAVSGGVGGLFGFAALAIELPISTTIILRSIADIARSEGLDIKEAATQIACLEVFALGGTSPKDDAAESGYWVVRASLAKTITDASAYIAQKATSDSSAFLFKLIGRVAKKFSVQITEKVAAQAVPAIGAIGGATINTLFMNHFQQMAKGHFIIKRLEKTYGKDVVELAYHEALLHRLEPKLSS